MSMTSLLPSAKTWCSGQSYEFPLHKNMINKSLFSKRNQTMMIINRLWYPWFYWTYDWHMIRWYLYLLFFLMSWAAISILILSWKMKSDCLQTPLLVQSYYFFKAILSLWPNPFQISLSGISSSVNFEKFFFVS